jgi:RNA recognition motif-containing protein
MSVRLFVGGLSFSTSTEGLREAFARFGTVQSAAVMMDRETGRSRGFGFVEMATTEEAERAMGALNGSSLDGRIIRVDKATPRGSGPAPRPRPAGGPPGPRSDRPAGGGYPPPRYGDRPPAFGVPERQGRGPQRRGDQRKRDDESERGRRKGLRPRGPGDDRGRGRGRPGSDGEYRWGR